MAVDVLGQTLYRKVSAQLQRPLVKWRSEGVVHRQQRPVFVGDIRNRADVRDHQSRIARRLDVDQLRLRPDGLAHRLRIGRIYDGSFYVKLIVQKLVEQPVYRDIGHAGKDYMIAAFQQGEKQSRQGGHAAGKDDAVLSAFQRRQLFLQILLIDAPLRVYRFLPALLQFRSLGS